MKTKVTINTDGSMQVEGMEKSPQCHQLLELAKRAGKVVSQEKKDHVPVYNEVNQRSN